MATAARSTTRSTTRRMPQDRKPKAAAAKTGDGYFSFTHKGKKYTFPKPFDVVRAPGFMRQNRRRDPLDLTFTMIEALADDDEDLLAVIDGMEPAEFQSLSTRMGQALQSSVGAVADAVGESEGS